MDYPGIGDHADDANYPATLPIRDPKLAGRYIAIPALDIVPGTVPDVLQPLVTRFGLEADPELACRCPLALTVRSASRLAIQSQVADGWDFIEQAYDFDFQVMENVGDLPHRVHAYRWLPGPGHSQTFLPVTERYRGVVVVSPIAILSYSDGDISLTVFQILGDAMATIPRIAGTEAEAGADAEAAPA